MGLFNSQKKESSDEANETGGQPVEKVLNLEIHTMPKKFLGLKPQAEGKSTPAEDRPSNATLEKAPASPIRKRLLLSVVVIVVAAIILGLTAFFLLRYLSPDDAAPTNEQPVTVPPVTTPVVPTTPTSPVSTTTPVTPPVSPPVAEPTVNAPSQITFSNIGQETLRVQWIDNSDNELGFRIYKGATDSFDEAEIVSTVGADIVNLTMANLECSNQYHFWVQSFIAATSSLGVPNTVSTLDCPNTVIPPTIQLDSDSDLLTEVEESLYGTSPDEADSDNDGYLDGQEVISQFDPRFADGALLSDSNSVRTFISNTYGYRLLVPVSWEELLVNGANDQVRFVGANQEFVEVIIEENSEQYDSVQDWYVDLFPSVPVSSLGEVKAQGLEGLSSPDGLTSYFLTNKHIFVITYNPGLDQQLNYLTTYRMMIGSFGLFDDPFTQF